MRACTSRIIAGTPHPLTGETHVGESDKWKRGERKKTLSLRDDGLEEG